MLMQKSTTEMLLKTTHVVNFYVVYVTLWYVYAKELNKTEIHDKYTSDNSFTGR